MSILERIVGGIIAVISETIFLVGLLFAIPSMMRYLRIRAM
ncbi:hypothetical protein [Fimbriiglobus ruber]|uniref:Uncharacterized protein n=1 Tax=Fimbriiglobus ruber TaxID=1908690 RepID=A0A225DVB5_9BACT|nr:hypothetical protein [Fimbriiglobus ruber]OWK45301.1 hypothetical protein FRUB_01632 [Fimbriiglobus ruber]